MEQRGALGSRRAAAEPDRPATTKTTATTRAARIPLVSALLPLRLELRLVRPLHGLVVLERLSGIDVAECRVRGCQLARRRDTEALREHSAQRLDRHLPEAGKLREPAVQLAAVRRLGPQACGVALILLGHDRGDLLHAPRHVGREAVDRRLFSERGFE